MLINANDFLRDLRRPPDERQHSIILMGMSNVGKSLWAGKISDLFGYRYIDYDDLIFASPELGDLVAGYEGAIPAEKLGRWLGLPWTEGYRKREETYLEIERKMMASHAAEKGVIHALTGSNVYHGEEMRRLLLNGLGVYLLADDRDWPRMTADYMKDPSSKAVCFREVFERKAGEDEYAALERCHPLLIQARHEIHTRNANIIIPYEIHRNCLDAGDLMREIVGRIPATAKPAPGPALS